MAQNASKENRKMLKNKPTRYSQNAKDKCWLLWHSDLPSGPHCLEKTHFEGPHRGFGLEWSNFPQVDVETAKRFLECYRAIPNAYHDIVLNDDGTVTMTLNAFRSTVQFIGLSFED